MSSPSPPPGIESSSEATPAVAAWSPKPLRAPSIVVLVLITCFVVPCLFSVTLGLFDSGIGLPTQLINGRVAWGGEVFLAFFVLMLASAALGRLFIRGRAIPATVFVAGAFVPLAIGVAGSLSLLSESGATWQAATAVDTASAAFAQGAQQSLSSTLVGGMATFFLLAIAAWIGHTAMRAAFMKTAARPTASRTGTFLAAVIAIASVVGIRRVTAVETTVFDDLATWSLVIGAFLAIRTVRTYAAVIHDLEPTPRRVAFRRAALVPAALTLAVTVSGVCAAALIWWQGYAALAAIASVEALGQVMPRVNTNGRGIVTLVDVLAAIAMFVPALQANRRVLLASASEMRNRLIVMGVLVASILCGVAAFFVKLDTTGLELRPAALRFDAVRGLRIPESTTRGQPVGYGPALFIAADGRAFYQANELTRPVTFYGDLLDRTDAPRGRRVERSTIPYLVVDANTRAAAFARAILPAVRRGRSQYRLLLGPDQPRRFDNSDSLSSLMGPGWTTRLVTVVPSAGSLYDNDNRDQLRLRMGASSYAIGDTAAEVFEVPLDSGVACMNPVRERHAANQELRRIVLQPQPGARFQSVIEMLDSCVPRGYRNGEMRDDLEVVIPLDRLSDGPPTELRND